MDSHDFSYCGADIPLVTLLEEESTHGAIGVLILYNNPAQTFRHPSDKDSQL